MTLPTNSRLSLSRPLRQRPEPPRAHPRLCKPSGSWTYRDASGATLQIMFLFDPPGERKQFLPCTLWRAAKGLRWRWKGLPAPRAADPDAPVVVAEGEKAADAAARVFPKSITTTSSGAQAAHKSDWTPRPAVAF